MRYYEPMNPPPVHIPVLAQEVIEWLNPQPGQIIVDGTFKSPRAHPAGRTEGPGDA